jgi:quercetin 2,3-dioxygenase
LKSFHSFSFANYLDRENMGFGNLRVINEDKIAAGAGFGTHGHQNMEIITYVLHGELGHRDSIFPASPQDSLGKGARIAPGYVQRMSAGRGIQHSEFNHSKTEETHLLQIWILPSAQNISPSYEQKHFSELEKRGTLRLVASPDGAHDSVTIHADTKLYAGLFDSNEAQQLAIAHDRLAYVFLVRGRLSVNDLELHAGDAMMLTQESQLSLRAKRIKRQKWLLISWHTLAHSTSNRYPAP